MLSVSTPAAIGLGVPAFVPPETTPLSNPVPRDSVMISEDSWSQGPGLAAIDAQIGDAGEKLQRLQSSIKVALANGDVTTLTLLSSRAGQLQAVLGSLFARVQDDERWTRIDNMREFARRLGGMVDASLPTS